MLSVLAFSLQADPKLARDFDRIASDRKVDVIVQYKSNPSDKHHEKFTKAGGKFKRKMDSLQTAVYSVTAGKLAQLSEEPDVAYITPDRPVKGMLDYTRKATAATIAHFYSWDGEGVGVAIIDSGLVSHADIAPSRVLYQESFIDGDTIDRYGHGTHVAAIVASDGNASPLRHYKGIAPKARLVILKVLDGHGVGSDSGVIAAIDRAIALKSTYNIRVINLSVGRAISESYTLDPLCQAVEQPGRQALRSWWRPVTKAATTRKAPTVTVPSLPRATIPT